MLGQNRAACPDMPWDAWPPHLPQNESHPIRVVAVYNQRGGTGNKLFSVAAGIALSHAKQLPLLVSDKVSKQLAGRGFPCIHTSQRIRDLPRSRFQIVRPNLMFGVNFQDLAIWGTADRELRPQSTNSSMWLALMRSAFRATAGKIPLAQSPAEDDLVIHFRDLRDCPGWRPATSEEQAAAALAARGKPGNASQIRRGRNKALPLPAIVSTTRSTYKVANRASRWFYDVDLYAPPLGFYESIIASHVSTWPKARVWVASMPCDRNHPTLTALMSRWPQTISFLKSHGDLVICDRSPSCKVPPLLDFVWLQKARRIVLSPSTFGWWAAFLSERATTIHYPILPAFCPWGPTMWCHLIPEDDERYIFHDVWARTTWRGGKPTGHDARRRCDVYMRSCLQAHVCPQSQESALDARHALPLEGLDEFLTFVDTWSDGVTPGHELDGLTTAELETAAHRQGLLVRDSNSSPTKEQRRVSTLSAIAAASKSVQEQIRRDAREYLRSSNRAPA